MVTTKKQSMQSLTIITIFELEEEERINYIPEMPAEGSNSGIVDGEVEEAEAAGLGANNANLIVGWNDDVLDGKLLHLLPWISIYILN